MRILAIDPGNTESGYAIIDALTLKPFDVGKISNTELRDRIINGDFNHVDQVSIEMIKSYGMPVGAEVFETCVWIGRFLELLDSWCAPPWREMPVDLVYRADIKLHHCHTSKAKDSNISQALVDRFASGIPNHGKGSKAAPGWFHGFKADIWAAYALAVYTADTIATQRSVEASLRTGAREAAS